MNCNLSLVGILLRAGVFFFFVVLLQVLWIEATLTGGFAGLEERKLLASQDLGMRT